ncbi:MAG: hypothetical protein OXR72_15735 [Gemmatimonadota bacterium]|nr:hypothetical protein [Gemmatimonadota bacterium]
MYLYRQVLTRMRLGESDRAIARSGLMDREKASALREVAGREGWLEASSVMPDDATLAQVLDVPSSRPQSASSVLPYQDKVTAWWRQGIRGTVIHQALVDTYGYAGSYSSVRRFLQNQEMVAVHPRKNTPGARSTVNEHLPPDARAFLMRDPQWCLKKAQTIGPACHTLIKTLFRDRVLDNLRAAQGIIGLSERYGVRRLEAACDRAIAFDNPRYRSVKNILEKGLDQCKHETQTSTDPHTLAAAYTGKGRFCRDATTLFS